jgi:Leucine-rich repeat (LRR) protein/tetratricopeptide (TPR) repeat protein
MSPEQAEGDQKKIGPASDIYSLGAMMYEMLTGDLPFRGSRRMLLYQILNEEPVPPRRINDRIPRDLDTICLKALSKEPEKRYTSAGDMATDLRRWLNGEPVLARPVSSTERFARWCKRNPRVAGLSAVVFLMAVGIAIVSTVSAMRLSVANEKIATERDAKDAAIRKQRQDALDSSEALAMQAVRAAEEVRWGEAEIRADFSKKLLIDGPWGDYALGMLAWKKNDFGSAEEHLRTALMNDPSHQLSKDGLAQVLVMSGQLNKAEELIAKTAHKGDWQAVRAAGKALFRAERYRQAEKAFAKALELISKVQASASEEKDWGKLLARADGFLASERFPEAKATLEKAIEILKSKGGTAPDALKTAREKLRVAEKELESLNQDLEYAKDDANAWTRCEGFEESLRGLSAEAQWQAIQQKMEELHGRPVVGRPAIIGGVIRQILHLKDIPRLRYLQPLRGLPLDALDCRNTKVSDLTALKGMPLTNLVVFGTKVSDLSRLRGMPLKYLHVGRTRVKDLSPLKGMSLMSFNCSSTNVTDLEPLRGMPIRTLGFLYTKVRDLSPLKDLPVTSLVFDHTEVSDLSPLKGMKLRYLICSFTKVKNLSPIAGMPLETLVAAHVPLDDLEILRGMPLRELHVGNGPFTDLSPLKGMPLKYLSIGGSKVSDLGPLSGMPLFKLSIPATKVSDLSPLKGMPLTHLQCQQTFITEFSPLKGMKLTTLLCGAEALNNWSVFREMPLKHVQLIGDDIADLSFLKGMELERLACVSKNLQDITPLSGMRLEYLDLASTQVKDLKSLKGMPLEKLILSHTPAADLTPLEGMKLKEFHPPPKDLLTPASLMLIDRLKKQGCKVVWK